MTAGPKDHDALREQAALYGIGALTGVERSAFEAHADECAECAAEVRAFLSVSSALAQAVPQHDPPAALRGRILAAVGRTSAPPRRTSALAPWLAAAAVLVATARLGVYASQLRQTLLPRRLQV